MYNTIHRLNLLDESCFPAQAAFPLASNAESRKQDSTEHALLYSVLSFQSCYLLNFSFFFNFWYYMRNIGFSWKICKSMRLQKIKRKFNCNAIQKNVISRAYGRYTIATENQLTFKAHLIDWQSFFFLFLFLFILCESRRMPFDDVNRWI